MSADHFSTAEWLETKHNRGYGALPIPQPRDEEIGRLLRTWMAFDERTREASANAISNEQPPVLLAHAERMTSLAVRRRDGELLTLGLLALGSDGWRGDWRENVSLISLHNDAAQ